MKRSALSAGFTLIELMVVLTIMGILTLGGIASYNEFNRKQRVKQTAEELVTQLRAQQKNADRSEIPPAPATCATLEGYEISYVSSKQLSFAAFCRNGGAPAPQGAQTYTLPNNVKMTGSFNSFVFRTLSRGITNTSLNLLGTAPVIGLTLVEETAPYTHTAQVTVSLGGSIDAQ